MGGRTLLLASSQCAHVYPKYSRSPEGAWGCAAIGCTLLRMCLSHPLCTGPAGDPFGLIFNDLRDDPYSWPRCIVCENDDDDDDAFLLAFQSLKTPVKIEMQDETISPLKSPQSASTPVIVVADCHCRSTGCHWYCLDLHR